MTNAFFSPSPMYSWERVGARAFVFEVPLVATGPRCTCHREVGATDPVITGGQTVPRWSRRLMKEGSSPSGILSSLVDE